MGKNTQPFYEKLGGLLSRESEIPALFTQTQISLSASCGVHAEGILSIEEYTDTKVVFCFKRNKVCITGENLHITCCENGMAELHGLILSVAFTEGGAFQC